LRLFPVYQLDLSIAVVINVFRLALQVDPPVPAQSDPCCDERSEPESLLLGEWAKPVQQMQRRGIIAFLSPPR
jgi:hypothetical protein